jgi:cell division septation protein DedD
MDRELSDHELAARVREHGTTWPGTDVTPSARPAIGAGEQRATPAAASAVQAVSMRPTIINAPVISATPVRQTASIAAATPTAAAPSPYATPTAAAASPYATPATTAVATPAQSNDIVPIESLLYDGNAALQRARAVRDELRAAWQRAGGTSLDPTTASLIDELSDLLDLAVAR